MAFPAARVSSVVACAKQSAVMGEFSGEMQSVDQQQSLLPTEVDHGRSCCLLFAGSACFPLFTGGGTWFRSAPSGYLLCGNVPYLPLFHVTPVPFYPTKFYFKKRWLRSITPLSLSLSHTCSCTVYNADWEASKEGKSGACQARCKKKIPPIFRGGMQRFHGWPPFSSTTIPPRSPFTSFLLDLKWCRNSNHLFPQISSNSFHSM